MVGFSIVLYSGSSFVLSGFLILGVYMGSGVATLGWTFSSAFAFELCLQEEMINIHRSRIGRSLFMIVGNFLE
jgi:hypothetical protein